MNYERICYGCFREKQTNEGNCPYCGYGPHVDRPANTLPEKTILNGRYLVGRVLGVGGFGATYLAYDMKLEEKCALKEYLPSGMAVRTHDRYTLSVIRSEHRSTYEGGMEKFLDEARILVRLKDVPNIVSVRDYFRENGTAYFVMQYVDGKSLKSLLKERGGRLPFAETVRILIPVMRALQQVHAKQLLHRDISPDNISLTKSGRPVLLDFGAARSSAGDASTMSVILKHGYAPIEQYSSHGNQGPWTDVYAMGATLYHCLTGQLPPNAVDRLRADGLVPPAALGVQLPPQAEAALRTALAVRPEDRFPSMQPFADALQASLSGSGAPTVGVPASGAGAPASGTPSGNYVGAPSGHPARRFGNFTGGPSGNPARRSGNFTGGPSGNPANRPGGKPSGFRLPVPALIGIIAGAAALVLTLILVNALKPDKTANVGTANPTPTPGVEIITPPPSQTTPTPQPTPAVTIDPENTEVYVGDAETGVTFRYAPSDGLQFTTLDLDMGSPYKAIVAFYQSEVELYVLRMGSAFDSPETTLAAIRTGSETAGYTVDEGIAEAQMGDLVYQYIVARKDDEMIAYYATTINGEVVLFVDDMILGYHTEEQAAQVGQVASTIELL